MRKSRLLTLGLLATVVAGAAGLARSAPEPRVAATDWQFEFEYDTPSPIQVRDAMGRPQTYWYMLYEITNRSDEEQYFVPDFVLYTDTGEVVESGAGVGPAVYQAIRRRHRNDLIENPSQLTGRVLRGADNARFGVAVFRKLDPQARSFDIFVGGLSGETARVELPVPVEVTEITAEGEVQTVARETIVLRKTLRLGFRIPGEPGARRQTVVIPAGQEWVMR